MRIFLYNIVSVGYSEIRFAVKKLFHFQNFRYCGIQRFSPNTEVVISGKGKLFLGKKVRAHRHSKLLVTENGVLKIGADTALGNGVGIFCMEQITIGASVQIGPDTKIYDHDHDFRAKGGLAAKKFKSSPVNIGDNTWIGCNTVILRGTVIGKNCVVGAGSILKGRYPDNSIIIQKRATEVTNYIFEE